MFDISQNTISFSLAILGSVLGVMNTWRAISKDKVRLRVIPKRTMPVGGSDPEINICIEVLNLSSFTLNIEETGFHLKYTNKRLAIINPITTTNENPPFRLEPRSSIVIYAKLYEAEDIRNIKRAYARTSCGIEKTGKSPALKQFIRNHR